MAILHLVSIYDRVAGFYQTPFFVPAPGVATRHFCDEINRKDDKNPLFKHSSDFDLYHLGEFDDNVGAFTPFAMPKLIIQGTSAKQEE